MFNKITKASISEWEDQNNVLHLKSLSINNTSSKEYSIVHYNSSNMTSGFPFKKQEIVCTKEDLKTFAILLEGFLKEDNI